MYIFPFLKNCLKNPVFTRNQTLWCLLTDSLLGRWAFLTSASVFCEVEREVLCIFRPSEFPHLFSQHGPPAAVKPPLFPQQLLHNACLPVGLEAESYRPAANSITLVRAHIVKRALEISQLTQCADRVAAEQKPL